MAAHALSWDTGSGFGPASQLLCCEISFSHKAQVPPLPGWLWRAREGGGHQPCHLLSSPDAVPSAGACPAYPQGHGERKHAPWTTGTVWTAGLCCEGSHPASSSSDLLGIEEVGSHNQPWSFSVTHGHCTQESHLGD